MKGGGIMIVHQPEVDDDMHALLPSILKYPLLNLSNQQARVSLTR